MLRALLSLAAAGLLCGCFVFEELDKGEKMMEQNSPRAATADKAQAQGAKKPQGMGEPGAPAGSAWWSEARSLNGPIEADPDDPNAPVSCKIRGSTRFMRRADCVSQGGRPS